MIQDRPPGIGNTAADRTFPDFLVRTAQAMRAERSLSGCLAGSFHPQLIRRDALGLGYGPQAAAEDLREQLVLQPGQEALTEDVIWCGSDRVGMLGAQRQVLRGRHVGPGPWGNATGRDLCFREMSEIYAKNGRISDMWVLRDSAAICDQIGRDPLAVARDRLLQGDPETRPFRPEIDQQGPYTGQGNDNHWGLAFADMVTRVMAGEIQVIPAQYDEACQLAYPGGRVVHGPERACAFWMGLRAALPDAHFDVHHRIGREDAMMPPRAALRWSLSGTHSGWGVFGPPSNARLYVMGMSHAEFGPGGLRREWTLFDAVAVWMQIASATG